MYVRTIAAGLAAALACTAAASAAGGPPPPKGASGQKVAVVGTGIPTPTAIAFAGGQTFVSAFGDEEHPKIHGGVFVLKGGKAVAVPGSPAHVMGLAAAGSSLYLSNGMQILRWSGWNGTKFTSSKVIANGPKGFSGFNGVAFAGGKLYAGISLGGAKTADFKAGATPMANQVVSVNLASGKLTTVAKGLRQPWQFTTVGGTTLVSDLGQENLGKKLPPDFVVAVKPGTDYGFPSCPAKASACSKFDRPWATFPAHSSPMGLGSLGGKVYVALFGGTGKGPEVVSLPASGGSKLTPVLVGFKAPVVALATHGGKLYAGDLTGSVYALTP
jgi:glucose/arabinose dehydrogenase